MKAKEELKKVISEVLSTNERDLKLPQLIIDIARDIDLNIISCETCAASDIEYKAYTIKNILQVMDKNKWDWEYYTLKNIGSLLNELK